MPIAFEAINTDIIKKLNWRSSAENQTEWLTKTPYARLVSFGVPKNDPNNLTGLRDLREKHILFGGYLMDDGHQSPDYTFGGTRGSVMGSYRTSDKDQSIYKQSEDKTNPYGTGTNDSRKYIPNPGIVSMASQNKGSYGSLRALNVQIKCYDLSQLETLEVLFMTPGVSILAEWGWGYGAPASTRLCSTDENLFSNKENVQTEITQIKKNSHGDYDACIATVHGFNWSIEKDGSYNVQIDATSRGDAMMSLPVNRSNGVLTDYVGRLTYDADAAKIIEAFKDGNLSDEEAEDLYGGEDNDISNSDLSQLQSKNLNAAAGEPKRINLLRVPVWKYNFGQEKLSERRTKANEEKKKAEETEKELKKNLNDAAYNDRLRQELWYHKVVEVMAQTRMTEMNIGGIGKQGHVDRFNLADVSTVIEGKMVNPLGEKKKLEKWQKRGPGIMAAFQKWKTTHGGSNETGKHRFNNVGAWGLAYFDSSESNSNFSKQDYYQSVGYGITYNWVRQWPNAVWADKPQPNDKKRDAIAGPGKIVSNDDGIVGIGPGSSDAKKYRPAFISHLYFDGGEDPILTDKDGEQVPLDVYGRSLTGNQIANVGTTQGTVLTFLAGNSKPYRDAYTGNNPYPLNSTVIPGDVESALSWNISTHKWKGKFNQDAGNHQRLEAMLKTPYAAMHHYEYFPLGTYDGTKTPDTKAKDDEISAPEAGAATDNTVYLDATFWNTKTAFEDTSTHINKQSVALKIEGGKYKTPDKNKPWKMYCMGLPRLPILSISVATKDGSPYVIVKDSNHEDFPDTPRIQSHGMDTEKGELYQTYTWWAFVDMQEWNESTGEFVFIENLKAARNEMSNTINEQVNKIRDSIAANAENLENINDFINDLNKTTGEYIPLFALEHMFNNTLNFKAKGKRVFRYDSGFLKYDESRGDHVPPPITDISEKRRILKEYADLFLCTRPGLSDSDGDAEVFSGKQGDDGTEGWTIFQRFFSGVAGNTVDEVSRDAWQPIVSLPVKINNHQELKSTNPIVCLLPGQEDIKPNSEFLETPAKDISDTGEPDNEYTCDEYLSLIYDKETLDLHNLPDPDLWVGLCPQRPGVFGYTDQVTNNLDEDKKLEDPNIVWPNSFATNSDRKFGYVGNILIHTDVIKKHLNLSTIEEKYSGESGGKFIQTFSEFYKKILNEINWSCGNMWQLGLQIDAETDNVCRIVDVKYTKDIVVTADTIWKFPLYGSDVTNRINVDGSTFSGRANHVIRDFQIQSHIPNGMQAMAMYGTNATFTNQSTSGEGELNSLQMLEPVNWADVSLEGLAYDSDTFVWQNGSWTTKEAIGITDASTGQILTSNELSQRGDIFAKAERDTPDGKLTAESQDRIKEEKIPVTYQDQKTLFRDSLRKIHDNGPEDSGGKHARRAEKCLYAMLNHVLPVDNVDIDQMIKNMETDSDGAANDIWTRDGYIRNLAQQELEKNNPTYFNQLIPLSCTITLDGISGIRFGNSFALGGLPSRYQTKTAFQVTNVSHQIDTNGWMTVITGQMRTIPPNASINIEEFTNVSDALQDGESLWSPGL